LPALSNAQTTTASRMKGGAMCADEAISHCKNFPLDVISAAAA
jgi:hypothetical protein